MTMLQTLDRNMLMRIQRYSIVLILALVSSLFAFMSPVFLSAGNLSNILLQAAATSIAAIGMTYVILLGEIDISIGSIISLAMTVGWIVAVSEIVSGQEAPVSFWIYPVGIFMGILLGLVNAAIINYMKINSFIATLATMFVYRGIAWKFVDSSDKPFSESAVLWLGRTEFLGIGLPVYLTVIVALVAGFILKYTVYGRFVFAMGGSPRSAVETGIPSHAVRFLAYGMCGFCCAIAGLITIGRVGVLQAGLGTGFEFTVIAAVVLGGTSLLGGRGTIIGSILGSLLLVTIVNGLNILNASVYIYDVIKGSILIIGVIVDVILFSHMSRTRRIIR